MGIPSSRGALIGTAISLGVTRSAGSLLFGLKSSDPATIAFAITALADVAFSASFLPAFRAARFDPVDALRRE